MGRVEIDQFIVANLASWRRLEALATKGRRRGSVLHPHEADELLALYDTVSGHLSVARTHFDDQTLNDSLSQLLGFARGLIYRPPPKRRNALTVFATVMFPAAVWQLRRFVLLAALVLLVPAAVTGVWLTRSDEVRNVTIDPEQQELIATERFEDYYSENPASAWVVELFTHNIQVTAIAFASGTVLVMGSWFVLYQNGLNLGVTAAVMYAADRQDIFWGLILPHGLLELSSIFLGAGAGMAIGWSVIAPGQRSRAQAIAETGMRSVVVMLGTMVCLVVAGITEAFVTPSALPAGMKVAIGAAWFVGLFGWTMGAGARAVANGATGTFRDLDDRATDAAAVLGSAPAA